MSTSSVRQTSSRVVEAPYATNWKAIWAMTGLTTLLAAYAMAWFFWPSPRPSEPADAHSLAVEQTEEPATPLPLLHAPPVAVPSPAQFAPVESVSVLGTSRLVALAQHSRVAIAAGGRKLPAANDATAGAKPASIPSDTNQAAATTDEDSNQMDILTVSLDGPRSESAWNLERMRVDLQSHSIELDLMTALGEAKGDHLKTIEAKVDFASIVSGRAELLQLAAGNPELAGLPFRRGDACRKTSAEATIAAEFWRDLHRITDRLDFQDEIDRERIDGEHPDTLPQLRIPKAEHALQEFLQVQLTKKHDDWSSTLDQMLQPHGQAVRLAMIDSLTAIDSQAATAALAGRALYDLSPNVREAASRALRDRPARDYRQQLLAGLRYPWLPVAAHAARALAAANDIEAIPHLDEMLREPDPSLPFENKKGDWVKTELVRVNHLRNCYLCHAPSTASSDPIRAAVPIPGEPLPVIYYARGSGRVVRADVTYLKQDFSLVQEVADPERWPSHQRFDYVTRTRPATLVEIAKTAAATTAGMTRDRDYPQRHAVKFALNALWEARAAADHRPVAATEADKTRWGAVGSADVASH